MRRATRSDPGELLDIKEAAAFLKVSQASLRRWTNAGKLACLRVGGRRERRFRRADLLAFLERAATVGPERASRGHAVIDGCLVEHGTHLCGLYDSEAARAHQAAGFLADGFHPGTVCYLVTETASRDEVLEVLRKRRPALDADIQEGRLILASYADSGDEQLAFWERRFLDATGAGAQSARVVGDVWGLAGGVTPEAVVQYERGYEERIARRFPVVTLCQYDVRRFSGVALLQALKGHPDTFRYPTERVVG